MKMSNPTSQPPNPETCNCWAQLVRIISQIEAPFAPPSGPQTQPHNQESSSRHQQHQHILTRNLPLDERLVLGEALVNQWELLNGCTRSTSHLRPALLRFVCDAVERMLTLYELFLSSSLSSSAAGEDPLSGGGARASVGALEFDEEDDIRAVAHAALSWSVVRLGAVLQDVEEESQGFGAAELREAGHERVKELTGRTLRLLGQVERIGGSG
ncbi:hypothetical protein BCR34DRAFT_56188 [Clohesyomyces aquaticus]|uniref:Uncharacterized protein n=1 Tax=Clohesyomyces aquaticus TaxID=1231657 RepID=A0A1Y1Z2C2_9PLEO|nr:hypothetical protein BCR34DRAFT_56188 [Clohesyomyces aquaticus]